MGFAASDVVPLTQARANRSELADQAKAGAEKIVTRNSESYVALIDAQRGLADIAAGRTQDADHALAAVQKRRHAATTPRPETTAKPTRKKRV